MKWSINLSDAPTKEGYLNSYDKFKEAKKISATYKKVTKYCEYLSSFKSEDEGKLEASIAFASTIKIQTHKKIYLTFRLEKCQKEEGWVGAAKMISLLEKM